MVYEGWVSLDRDILDITNASDWKGLLRGRKPSNILAEHVLEHLNPDEIDTTMHLIAEHLAPGGVFRMAVPDGFHPSGYVRDLVKPDGLEPGADDHKVLLTIEDMRRWETLYGLELQPVEYFEADGVFVQNVPISDRGPIRRSAKQYTGRFTASPEELDRMLNTTPIDLREQFRIHEFSYTSLWVDWVKSTTA